MSKKPNELFETLKTIVITLLLVGVLRTFLFQPFTIPSASMEPGLIEGDYIVATKFDYGFSRYSAPFALPLFDGRIMGKGAQRGDVVVFQLPRDPKVTYIKRVIGLPGDRVQMRDGVLYVNDQAVPREAVGQQADPDQYARPVAAFRETLASGKSYVTLDRGPAEGDDTEVFLVPADHYFMMGDNRDNSADSRWPSAFAVGFVPAENLLGKARSILVSWNTGASLFKPWTWVTELRWNRLFKSID